MPLHYFSQYCHLTNCLLHVLTLLNIPCHASNTMTYTLFNSGTIFLLGPFNTTVGLYKTPNYSGSKQGTE